MAENNTDNKQEYVSLLKDDDNAARPVTRKKKDPMAKVRREIEEQQRQQREKAELLKLKQGIIEESEEIPEDKPPTYEKPKGWKAVENFFYHYKWMMGGTIFAVALVTFLVVQTVTKQRNDLYVLVVANDASDGFYAMTDQIEIALERYCPDFDGNGYVHVGVNFVDLSSKTSSQYSDTQYDKFSAEVFTGSSQLYITDHEIVSLINAYTDSADNVTAEAETSSEEESMHSEYFLNLSELYPDAEVYQDVGVQLNTTGFADEANWSECPDAVGIYIRNEFEGMTGNDKSAQEQRRRAQEVLNNIMTDNVVNPDWEGD